MCNGLQLSIAGGEKRSTGGPLGKDANWQASVHRVNRCMTVVGRHVPQESPKRGSLQWVAGDTGGDNLRSRGVAQLSEVFRS